MRILHPTDFSQPAQKALAIARDLRARTGGTLHVVHAQRDVDARLPGSPSQWAGSRPQLDTFNPELLNQLAQERSATVEKLRGMLSHMASPDGTYELLWGNPVEELLQIQEQYDLVVMGAHGASRFDRHFLGGVAGRFIRRTSVPVISVREETTTQAVKRVVVATDFGKASQSAWEFALGLKASGVDIVLAHVVDDEELVGVAEHTALVTRRLSAISGGEASRLIIKEGVPALVLPQLAEEAGADLIAIGMRHHSAAVGLLLGSRADALLRSSAVPVLSVPLVTA